MKEPKTENLTIRIAPASKRALSILADLESRSMANSIEWLVRGYFDSRGISWPPEEPEADPSLTTKPTSTKTPVKRKSNK